MPGPLDFALVALFSVALPLYSKAVSWPRYLERLRAGVPNARLREYRSTLVEQWMLAAVILLLWAYHTRSWAELGLRAPEGWRLWLGAALVVATAALFRAQVRSVAARPAARASLRQRLGALDPVLPHTLSEFRTFLALSFTAGVCEELLFRGFFIWVLSPWLTWWGAAVLGTVLFGLAHSYQGRAGMIRAGVAGLVMAIVYAACGSLLPGMALHAIIDMGGGWTTWLVFREEGAPSGPTAIAA